MSSQSDIRERVTAWHRSEDSLYRSVLQEPALYTSCIRLVRALADGLSEVDGVDALMDAYSRLAPDFASSIADSLDLSHGEFLDYDLATDAAFYLRYQEILETITRAGIQERVNRAQSEGAEWGVLYEEEMRSRGHTFFERLEMHLANGIGLRTSSELDWEKGRVYVVEPLNLDPETGQPKRGEPAPGPAQEFATHAEMLAAVDALRARFSMGNTNDSSTTEGGAPNG